MSFRLRRAAAAVRSLCACVCMRHTVIVSRVAIAASAVASVASVVSVATVELVHVHILPRKCGHRALGSLPPFFGAPWGGVLAPACGCVASGACLGRSLPGSRLPVVTLQHPPTTHRWGSSGSLPCLRVASARGGQSALVLQLNDRSALAAESSGLWASSPWSSWAACPQPTRTASERL